MSKRVDHPIILGIVGDSASGKSTLSAGVAQILGEEHCTVICTDDYHRYDRKARAAAGLSALDPRSNYVDILEQHLRLLRERRADPEAGLRSQPRHARARRICAGPRTSSSPRACSATPRAPCAIATT